MCWRSLLGVSGSLSVDSGSIEQSHLYPTARAARESHHHEHWNKICQPQFHLMLHRSAGLNPMVLAGGVPLLLGEPRLSEFLTDPPATVTGLQLSAVGVMGGTLVTVRRHGFTEECLQCRFGSEGPEPRSALQ